MFRSKHCGRLLTLGSILFSCTCKYIHCGLYMAWIFFSCQSMLTSYLWLFFFCIMFNLADKLLHFNLSVGFSHCIIIVVRSPILHTLKKLTSRSWCNFWLNTCINTCNRYKLNLKTCNINIQDYFKWSVFWYSIKIN